MKPLNNSVILLLARAIQTLKCIPFWMGSIWKILLVEQPLKF